jgi:hypothetical protein
VEATVHLVKNLKTATEKIAIKKKIALEVILLSAILDLMVKAKLRFDMEEALAANQRQRPVIRA